MGTEITGLKLTHLSDLHFGPPYLEEVGDAIVKRLEEWQPDVVVVTGDLTQRARFKQFVEAKSFFSRFPTKSQILVLPGNHDIPLYRFWERLFTPYKLFQTLISAEKEVVVRLPGLVAVGIDSTHPFRRIKGGRVSARELDRCAREFGAGDAFKIAAFHHPVFLKEEGVQADHWVLGRLREMGTDLVLCGHVHHSAIYAVGPEEAAVTVVLCGTSSSSRGRLAETGGNSMNEIHIEAQQFSVVRRVYEIGDRVFLPTEEKTLRRRNLEPK